MFGAPGSAACQGGQGQRDRRRARPALPARGARRQLEATCWRACRLASPPRRQDAHGPAGHVVLQAANQRHQAADRADPTAQFFVLRDNVALFGNEITNPQQSRPTRAGSPTSRSASPATARTPSRASPARSPTAARSAALGPAGAQPALRGRARHAAGHGPVDRLQAVPGRDHRRQRRRHHRRVHDQLRAGPGHPAATRRAADQPEADLRVARSRRRSVSRRCTRA